ncbi:hypothetical protein Zm00014a_043336 [Zea mays]|uniref:Uncharacterized protein n=2 Tax=Zea mays TaxID=4577 RepID=A0A8J8XAD7_MAIZE|nr:DUF241 domain protein [Zea mays]PWZ05419.1 hypothetical protein Zm00014a_043336 [Zea mays]
MDLVGRRPHAVDVACEASIGQEAARRHVCRGAQMEAAADPEERERKAAFERLDNLGRCIADVESSGEKVFRALVNTRVSLLNILSPAF